MSGLIPFHFGAKEVRIQLDEHNEPWWVLQDCCTVLGLTTPHKAAARLDTEDRKKSPILDAQGYAQESWLINESGLYTLLLRSSKPEARQFKLWVTREVLPQIRKTGKYELKTPDYSDALERSPEHKVIVQMAQSVIKLATESAEQRLMIEQNQKEIAAVRTVATMAMDAQEFFTIAEYVYRNKLEKQLPRKDYRAASNNLFVYCGEHGIPVRTIAVGGKSWTHEYAYHVSVYTEVFHEWLKRYASQTNITLLPKPHDDTAG